MHERKKWSEEELVAGLGGRFPGEPVFPDWDNPEDNPEDEEEDAEGAPEGDYDEDSYVPGPDDPDYDLSETAGYAGWEEPRRGMIPGWLIVAASILLILALLVPLLLRIS
jgi:hypothetical protein